MGRPVYIFGQFRETARCRDAQHGDGVCCAFAPQPVNITLTYRKDQRNNNIDNSNVYYASHITDFNQSARCVLKLNHTAKKNFTTHNQIMSLFKWK